MSARFPHLPTFSELDTTKNFEYLQPIIGGLEADTESLDHDVSTIETELRSNVLRLATAGDAKISYGVAEVEWPGASETSTALTISGLPGSTFGYYFAQSVGVAFVWYAQVLSPEATKFKVQGVAPSKPAKTKEKFYWVAVNG